MSLTIEQKKLVEDHLNIVPYILNKYIKNSEDVEMNYEDLLQEGNLALCKAAIKYNGSVKFNTFAEIVVKHELLGYCKKTNRKIKTVELPAGKSIEEVLVCDDEEVPEMLFNAENLKSIRNIKNEYSGVVLKGIEAIELKMQGLAGVDIAAIYKVKPNYVSAWIAKAKRQLLTNEKFLNEISCNL